MTRSVQAGMLRLLSSFDLNRDGVAISLASRAQRLVALLAISDRPLSRSAVAAKLWPDVVNARANASLRATLWSFPHPTSSPILIENNMLSLDPAIRLDLTEAKRVANAVIDGTYVCGDRACEEDLQEDLLPSWSDEWLITEREGYRQLRLHALDALCVLHAGEGRYARAITVGLASVSSEPTRESAHRALMTAHLLEGNRMEAIRQYHEYLAMARTEMGIGPSNHLQRLLHDALEDAPRMHRG
jgi:DNA-binding SARP family transcriptional activator